MWVHTARYWADLISLIWMASAVVFVLALTIWE